VVSGAGAVTAHEYPTTGMRTSAAGWRFGQVVRRIPCGSRAVVEPAGRK